MAQNTFIVKSLQRTNGSYRAEIEFQGQVDKYDIFCNYKMYFDDKLGLAILDDNYQFPQDGIYFDVKGETVRARIKHQDL